MADGQDTQEGAVDALLRTGATEEARRLLVERIRSNPSDQRARMFLFQLLAVEGDYAKARAQLRALGQLSPEAGMLASAYNQAIDGELERRSAFGDARPPSLLKAAPQWAADLAATATSTSEEAARRRAAALDACPDIAGEVDGRPFGMLFDGDGRFGPMLEACITGRWGLIPFSEIEEIATPGPVDLRDLVWLPAEIRFRDGPALAALLPVRYPGSEEAESLDLRLARRTEWHEDAQVLRGLGQRVWTTDAGEDVPILGFRRIRFAGAA